MATRLLVLSCSKRKRLESGVVPAIERYNGPSFQLFRKFRRRFPFDAESVEVYILSAEFGLIPHDYPIPVYDRVISCHRAQTLQSSVLATFRALIESGRFADLFINAGRTYLEALRGYEEVIPREVRVVVATGSPGRRLAQLYQWLYPTETISSVPVQPSVPHGKVRIRGVELTLSKEQVLNMADRALATRGSKADNYQTWSVGVGDRRVSVKWLVSQITGLSVGDFSTAEARRVLAQLGIEVQREW